MLGIKNLKPDKKKHFSGGGPRSHLVTEHNLTSKMAPWDCTGDRGSSTREGGGGSPLNPWSYTKMDMEPGYIHTWMLVSHNLVYWVHSTQTNQIYHFNPSSSGLSVCYLFFITYLVLPVCLSVQIWNPPVSDLLAVIFLCRLKTNPPVHHLISWFWIRIRTVDPDPAVKKNLKMWKKRKLINLNLRTI